MKRWVLMVLALLLVQALMLGGWWLVEEVGYLGLAPVALGLGWIENRLAPVALGLGWTENWPVAARGSRFFRAGTSRFRVRVD